MPNFAKLLETAEPAALGPGPRTGVLSEGRLDESLDAAFKKAQISPANQQLIRALVLLWHDHLDAAHTLAQSIENADGAYVHGIMHRREPDYGNAAYWFRRVGRHQAFPELTRRASELLAKSADTRLQSGLIPRGHWDPLAFINACERAAGSGSREDHNLLREIQRIEFEVLLASLVGDDVSRL